MEKNMSEHSQATTKKFSWKLYGFILLLVALGALAKIPSAIYIEGLVNRPETWTQVTIILFLQDFLVMGLLPAGLGLLVIQKLGLRLPILNGFVLREKSDAKPGNILREVFTVAVALGIIGMAIQAITKPMILNDLAKLGIDPGMILQNNNSAPWWAMSLLAVSAGIVEEVAFRLGLLSLLAWLGSLIWKPKEGKLRNGVFWTVNIIIAILFSLAHFANVLAAGIPLALGIVLRTLVGNSLAALVFGWLYWKRGLVSAMLTHTFLDVFVYVIAPLFVEIAS
jgi:hypothetical protein